MSIFDDFDNWSNPRTSNSHANIASVKVEQQLFNAASRGQVEKVLALLDTHPAIDLHHQVNGFNAAHMCAKKGRVEILKLLLSRDASLTRSRAADLRTAQMLAAFENQRAALELLHEFDQGKDDIEEAIDHNGNTALHYAAWGGSLSCVQFLVEVCGKAVHVLNLDSVPPMQFAAAGNHADIVQYLMQHVDKEDVMMKEDCSVSGMTTLHRAAAYGALDTVQMILAQPAYDVNKTTDNGSTALHYAAQHGHFSIVEYLCSVEGIRADDRNDFGLTPLHFACIGGFAKIVALLLVHGADPQQKNRSGDNSLHIAAANGQHEICRFLHQQAIFDVFEADAEGKTCIDKAVEGGYKELANTFTFWSCVDLRVEELSQLLTH